MTIAHRLMRAAAVRDATGLSKSSLYRAVRRGRFPKPVLLAIGPGARCVAWPEHEVRSWIEECVSSARNKSQWQAGDESTKGEPT